MRKTLCSLARTFRLFVIFAAVAGWYNADAQCGTSGFLEGGTLTPTSAWTNVSVGSNTYVNFNTVAGNIYSFRYSNTGVGIYNWDMTLSSTSAVIPYNNSLTPVRDSWT